MDLPDVFIPSHHFMAIQHSLDSRCKPKPVEGTTDSQKKDRGAASNRRRALLALEKNSKKLGKDFQSELYFAP